MYDAMAAALKATGIPFAEDGWDTHPPAPWGVYAIDGEGETLHGDDRHELPVSTGTVDLFVLGSGRALRRQVEAALALSGVWWSRNSRQYEDSTHLTHYEWVFEVIDGE